MFLSTKEVITSHTVCIDTASQVERICVCSIVLFRCIFEHQQLPRTVCSRIYMRRIQREIPGGQWAGLSRL